jgi:serine/threonine-protein kinase
VSDEQQAPPRRRKRAAKPAADATLLTAELHKTVLLQAPAPTQFAAPGQGEVGAVAVALQRIEIGAVLNGIYRIIRAIGRGGMSEVFEAVNVNHEDDRVAVKVILPALADDEMAKAMFVKEARALSVLTRLAHPALVQYRLIAQDPTLGLLYMVTEFIDGVPLTAAIGRERPSVAEMRALTRRLAEGLQAAHEAGAVHRDISPENIMLPDGRLQQAKIIDFGIVKSLSPADETILGDGFAGKLGYVAPEQLGDFGRDVGPWTDVYSLGLVIATVALGRSLDMGKSPYEAVIRRKEGPDLSALPDDLRPLLSRMVAANPADRFRSMDEVLAALDQPAVLLSQPAFAAPPPPPTVTAQRRSPVGLMAAVGAGVAMLALGGWWLLRAAPKPAAPNAVAAAASPPTVDPRPAILAALPGISCSWLTVGEGSASPKLTGAAGSPASAEAALDRAAGGARVDMTGVAQIGQPLCPVLDAFRFLRASDTGAPALSATATDYPLTRDANGQLDAHPMISIDVPDETRDLAVYGVDDSGVAEIAGSRAALKAAGANVQDLGQGQFRMTPATNVAGPSGVLLIVGRAPFDRSLITTTHRDAAWEAKLRQAAVAGGWKADMVWFTVTPAAGG